MVLNLNNRLKIFIFIALPLSLIYILLVLQRRLPVAHDTFQYLQLQYVYFNEVVQHYSLPLWFPFTMQGFVGNYYFTPQITLLSGLFYLLGLFLKSINYLYLFYFALWFEELFFLLGVILLASVYYKDIRSILFVAITLWGTSIWYPQVWWSFHLYYFIPIILYCLRRAIQTGLFRYFLFSLAFFTLAVQGNFVYAWIFICFVLLLYILFVLTLYLKEIKIFLRSNLKFKNFVVVAILITVMSLSFYYIKYADSQITRFSYARDFTGKISLDNFLTYGGSIGLSKYKDIFLRYTDSIDINLYMGLLLVPFVLVALLQARNRLSLGVGGVALTLFLFSNGTFVSKLFYYLFPFGNIFRHIGLTETVFKLFIVFYAGFGLEIFLEKMLIKKKLIIMLLVSSVVLACIFIIKNYLLGDIYLKISKYFWYISDLENVFFVTVAQVVFFISIPIFFLMYKPKVNKNRCINFLLLLLMLDLFSYKYSFIVSNMPKVSEEIISLFKPYKYDFLPHRFRDISFYSEDNQRMKLLHSLGPREGTKYNTTESFFFTDSALSLYRVDFILKSIKEYFEQTQKFPNKNGIYEKYAGINYPKIQVFSRLNLVRDETEMGKIFSQKDFTGDMLFTTNKDIQGIEKSLPSSLIQPQNAADFVNRNERLNADVLFNRFSFNTLSLKAVVNGPSHQHCFLYYSDAYHPYWNAYVNGKKTAVIKSNIGYKSVMIPYGVSEVVFKFGNAFYKLSFFCSIFLNLALLCLIIYIFFVELYK